MTPPPEPLEDGLRADALTPAQKRVVWAHIRAHEPALSAFLTSPEATAIRDQINARFPGACSPVIPFRTLRAALSDEEFWELRRH